MIQSKTVWSKKKYTIHTLVHKYSFRTHLSFLSQEAAYYFKEVLTIQYTSMYAETPAEKWLKADSSLPLQFSSSEICFCSPLEQNQTALYSKNPEPSKLLVLDKY